MRKTAAVLCALVLVASVFATPQAEGKSSGAPKVVRMWTFLNPAAEGAKGRDLALKKIIESFERENPGIDIVVEPQQWDLLSPKFLAAHQAGNAPDVQWTVATMMGDVLRAGAYADFESVFMNKWSAADKEDVDGSFWRMGTEDGKHYQNTFSRNYYSLFYREDLFKDAGISMPIRSWDELIAAAKKLTGTDAKSGIKRWGLGMGLATEKVDPPIAAWAMLEKQKDLFADDGKVMWSTPAGVEAVQLVVDMLGKHQITPPNAVSMTVEDVYGEFNAGKYAMMSGGGVRITRMRSEAAAFNGSTIQQMLWPSFSGKTFSPAGINGWSVGVWSKSKVKAEAGKFVEALMSREADKLWVLDGGQIPMRNSTIAAMPDFFGKPENAFLKVQAEGIAKYGYPPSTKKTVSSNWWPEMNKAIQDAVVNKTPVKDALLKIEGQLNK